MKTTVHYSAVLRLKNVSNGSEIETAPGSTITDLLDRFEVRAEQQKYIISYVNGKKTGHGRKLQEGDSLQLFLPIGGG